MNEDGVTDAFLVNAATNAPMKVNLPHGLNFFAGNPNEFSPQSNRVIGRHLDLRSSLQPCRTIDYSAVASLRGTPLPASQPVHYKSFDGKIITALLWMPPMKADDVAVLYVEPLAEGSVVREMSLNDRGELVKAWPGGFFEEGLREVMP